MKAAIPNTGKAFQIGIKAPHGEDGPLLIDESLDDVPDDELEDEPELDEDEGTKTKLGGGGFGTTAIEKGGVISVMGTIVVVMSVTVVNSCSVGEAVVGVNICVVVSMRSGSVVISMINVVN